MLMMIAFYAVPTNLALFIESEKTLFYSHRPLFDNAEDLKRHLESGTVSDKTLEAFRSGGIPLGEPVTFSVEKPGYIWRIRDARREYLVKKERGQLSILAERLGRPAIAGYALSIMTLSGVLSGLLLTFISTHLRRLAVPLAIALMAIGFAVLGKAEALWMVFAGVPLIGFSAGILMPTLLLCVQQAVEPQARALAMAVVSGGIFLGQFLSPIVLKSSLISHGQDTGGGTFLMVAAGLVLAALVSLFLSRGRSGSGVSPRKDGQI